MFVTFWRRIDIRPFNESDSAEVVFRSERGRGLPTRVSGGAVDQASVSRGPGTTVNDKAGIRVRRNALLVKGFEGHSHLSAATEAINRLHYPQASVMMVGEANSGGGTVLAHVYQIS